MRVNREKLWLHWFVSGKPHASAIMFKAAPSKNPLLIRLLFPGVREPAALPRVTRTRPGLWSAIFLAFRSVLGGFRAPVSARHFSNFRLAVAEIGSIANRDWFAGHPSGIRRIPAREPPFTANAALPGENRFLSVLSPAVGPSVKPCSPPNGGRVGLNFEPARRAVRDRPPPPGCVPR
jgi:hypothetical protein